MLRNIRLVSIALSLAILSTLAPSASAGPLAAVGLELDIMSRIEAVFSDLSKVFFGAGEQGNQGTTTAFQSEFEPLTSVEVFGEAIPSADPNGATPSADPNGATPSADPNGATPSADPNGFSPAGNSSSRPNANPNGTAARND